MKKYRTIITLFFVLICTVCSSQERAEVFSAFESKDEFAREVSGLVGKAWQAWQDEVIINGVEVESSQGLLLPGDLSEPVLSAKKILEPFNRTGRKQEYINCMKTIAEAIGDGMRAWQRGYTHTDLVFPQGASCVYTLPPCDNVPVTVESGSSSGDNKMTEEALYKYMLYNSPNDNEALKVLFKGAAKGIVACFDKWKRSCSIVGIHAKGGIAPAPAPIGSGPGPVRGAKGNGGKLVGSYFDTELMYRKMTEYIRSQRLVS